ncbi:MAG: hypothetical protein M3O34_02360 [Chloroflexota bacterium]|nr:hypothetical protein [Chloroflexota bacterium]
MSDLSPFTAPVERMGLDADTIVEVGIASGTESVRDQSELERELQAIEGLETRQYARKGGGFEQLVFLAGASASIVPALDVVWRWYRARRYSQGRNRVEVTLRSRRSGELRLSAHDEAEARALVQKLQRMYE